MQKLISNTEAMWGKSPWVINLKCFQEKHECLKRRGTSVNEFDETVSPRFLLHDQMNVIIFQNMDQEIHSWSSNAYHRINMNDSYIWNFSKVFLHIYHLKIKASFGRFSKEKAKI